MNAFLDCNIWSISTTGIDKFFLVEKVYNYNSLTDGIVEITPGFVQVPEFEIKDLHLLDGVDYNIINSYSVPIVQLLEDDSWKINLKYYEQVYSNLQQ